MTDASDRHHGGALGWAIIAGATLSAMALRGAGLLGNHALSSAGYDEGVYASTAALLTRGELPYRDYVLLHPPVLALLLAPVAAVAHAVGTWADFLVVARWLVVLVAGANVVLVGVLAHRWKGWVAAAVATALVATYVPSVLNESHVLLEPFVALGLLLTALVWLGPPTGARSDRRSTTAGVLAALTMLVKLTGAVALLGIVCADGLRTSWHQRRRALVGAAVTAVVVLVPFLLAAGPTVALRQIVVTQLGRPGKDVSGGSIAGISGRLEHLGSYGPFALDQLGSAAGRIGALIAAAVVVWAWRTHTPTGRFFASTGAVGVALVLLSPDYYDQYPVVAFAALSVIIGGAAGAAVDALRARHRALAFGGLAALALVLLAGAGSTANTVRDQVRDLYDTDPRAELTSLVGDACVSGDLPELLLALDRVPPHDRTGDRFVDPFGTMVDTAIRHGDYATTQDALYSDRAQALLRSALSACPFAVTRDIDPPPGRWSPSTVRWFTSHFDRVAGNDDGVQLWSRRPAD